MFTRECDSRSLGFMTEPLDSSEQIGFVHNTLYTVAILDLLTTSIDHVRLYGYLMANSGKTFL